MWSNFKLLSIVNQMKKTKCFARDYINNQLSLKFCVQNPGLLKNLWGNANWSFFNVSTDNSIVESLAWIIFPEICSDKSWKLTEIFYFYQIDTRIKVFNNKNCKVTFGFEYVFRILFSCIPDKVFTRSGYFRLIPGDERRPRVDVRTL